MTTIQNASVAVTTSSFASSTVRSRRTLARRTDGVDLDLDVGTLAQLTHQEVDVDACAAVDERRELLRQHTDPHPVQL